MPNPSRCQLAGALALALALWLGAATPVNAAPPPDEFRSEFVGALSACVAAYNALASNNDFSTTADDEMRDASRGQERWARGLLKEWSGLADKEMNELVLKASLELHGRGIEGDDKLLDLTIYCDDGINNFINTANRRGYTP